MGDILLTEENLTPKIAVIGVGGGGCNIVNDIIKRGLSDIEFIAANTDLQVLSVSKAKTRLQLGKKITKGQGTGGMPEVGKIAAEESEEEIRKSLQGLSLLFIATGMGGGTGSGSSPVIAKVARELDILTIAIITKPFDYESRERIEYAEQSILELKKYVNTMIILPNENLYKIANQNTTLEESFSRSNDVLYYGIKGLTDLIFKPGLINIDFSDVSVALKKMGKAIIGIGEAEGENRGINAVEQALSNPLLEDISINGAESVLVNVSGGSDLTLFEQGEIMNKIKEKIGTDRTFIKPGASIVENFNNKIRVIIFATGINDSKENIIETKKDKEVATIQIKETIIHDTKKEINKIESDKNIEEKKIEFKITPKAPIRIDNNIGDTQREESFMEKFFKKKDKDKNKDEILEFRTDNKKIKIKSAKPADNEEDLFGIPSYLKNN
jgi:cell division protein FtsZ